MNLEQITETISNNRIAANNRTAVLMLKYLLAQGKSGEEEEIEQLTVDPFERVFIPLAAYWSNDMIDVCFAALGIEQPEEYPSYDSTTRDKWYEWFENTINGLTLND